MESFFHTLKTELVHHRLRHLVGAVNQIRPSKARVFRGVQLSMPHREK